MILAGGQMQCIVSHSFYQAWYVAWMLYALHVHVATAPPPGALCFLRTWLSVITALVI